MGGKTTKQIVEKEFSGHVQPYVDTYNAQIEDAVGYAMESREIELTTTLKPIAIVSSALTSL